MRVRRILAPIIRESRGLVRPNYLTSLSERRTEYGVFAKGQVPMTPRLVVSFQSVERANGISV